MKKGQYVDTALCRDMTANVITELVTSLSCSTEIRASVIFFISFSCCLTMPANETVISPPSAEQKITSIILRHAYFRLWFKDLNMTETSNCFRLPCTRLEGKNTSASPAVTRGDALTRNTNRELRVLCSLCFDPSTDTQIRRNCKLL